MALIACPDCRRMVSDQARTCPYCGLPVVARLAQLQREEEERLAEEEALRQHQANQRTTMHVVLGVVAVILFFLVASCISNVSQHPVLQNLEATGSQKPGDSSFSAQGKLSVQYSCEASTERATTVRFSLVNMHASAGSAATVWEKVINCTTPSQSSTMHTETVQVKSSTYTVGVIASTVDTTWNIIITQA